VVIVGIAGVVHDSLARSVPASYINLHALFGALLWVSVVARFQRRLRQSPRMLPGEIREFSRHLSRLVYLMLYILMFASLITGALTCTWRTDCVVPPDFQGYLGYGFFALITIHVLAAMCRQTTGAMVFSETGS
jgi:cytochrome b561